MNCDQIKKKQVVVGSLCENKEEVEWVYEPLRTSQCDKFTIHLYSTQKSKPICDQLQSIIHNCELSFVWNDSIANLKSEDSTSNTKFTGHTRAAEKIRQLQAKRRARLNLVLPEKKRSCAEATITNRDLVNQTCILIY